MAASDNPVVARQKSITILVADDHPLLRRGLRMTLSAEPDIQIVGEAENGQQALDQILSLKPDVAILDIDMPGRGGFEIVRELNRLRSPVAVVILTLHTGIDLLQEALEIGVRGYVLKSSAATDIAAAARSAMRGESFLSPEALRVLEAGKGKQEVPPELASLSPVELRLVQEIANGKTSKEIAAALDLSARTIENYRTVICAKLNLTGANALLRYALSQRAALRRV